MVCRTWLSVNIFVDQPQVHNLFSIVKLPSMTMYLFNQVPITFLYFQTNNKKGNRTAVIYD